jgi:hypothetical protein
MKKNDLVVRKNSFLIIAAAELEAVASACAEVLECCVLAGVHDHCLRAAMAGRPWNLTLGHQCAFLGRGNS